MNKQWWKESVVYQIYPRSFKDSNGDGIGDLRGIIEKLDYLKTLGVDVVWLSPIYRSPNDDNGYDISDYRDIMTEFGTMKEFDELLAAMHERGIKLMMDLVVNHSSDEHQWFIDARGGKDSPYRDYYYFRPGVDGGPPNNWRSSFGGPAWDLDPSTGEYYLHLFSKKQPDLNWENPALRKEVYELMKFWLDKGIDGFRMDVINFISKPEGLPSSEPGTRPGYLNGPRVHEFLQEMNREVLSKYDIVTVGETPGVTPEDAIKYASDFGDELNMVFQFEHMDIDCGPQGKWDVKPYSLLDLKKVMSKWQTELEGKAWNSLYLNNHDQPRMVSRFGNDNEYRVESAKMLATFLHMQKGTPYIYQGEEIGMTNVVFERLEDYNDIESHGMYREAVHEQGREHAEVMELIRRRGRDNARTPVQWDSTQNGGFTNGTPWLKVNPNYTSINVESALSDKNSIFYYYQRLIQLRKEMPIVVYGRYDLILEEHPKIYAFTRTLEEEKLLVINNFSGESADWVLPEISYGEHSIVISNYEVSEAEEIQRFTLRPYESRVYLLRY